MKTDTLNQKQTFPVAGVSARSLGSFHHAGSGVSSFNHMKNQYSNNCPQQTPWGYAQHREKIADGIWQVCTAGHGGFWLCPERMAELPEAFQNFPTFCKSPQWFEEDCDWAVVALSFPLLFTPDWVSAAMKTAPSVSYMTARYTSFMNSDRGLALLELVNANAD